MPYMLRGGICFRVLLAALLVICATAAQAETVEQKVWIKAVDKGDGQCKVMAYFKGDQDNCANHDAHGRSDCDKDAGCVCTRQEKHITWEMDGKESFSLVFDQGDKNPFVQDGDSECNFKSNKKGRLRCRVKGKDVPKGLYRYSVEVPHCAAAKLKLKLY